ncbi:glycine zipper 2TM domain-containing protein [Sphingomonas sp. M1-B02]|uniref:glycine zipper 2TM domain-containing protein n=1 Tax=Sphingomonas sp. M1-B02 TaxID=3114300 RepID=UPI0022400964|nr:glycine zipper 2TM domain-containing protein [Sphingomonas sp. S6-11]UZK66888.1 glycine zipper 2TM domain-containing protein [Sphingomonas sp. S6-11]
MKTIIGIAALAAGCLVVATPAAAQTGSARYAQSGQDEDARFDAAQRRFDSEYETFQAAVERYRRSRTTRPGYDNRGNDPRFQQNNYDDEDYDPARDYRSGNYQERVLSRDENVYRGDDGRYYCRRSDGTTGLIVGAAAGGLFGNVISGRRTSTVGTLLGAIAGGAAGSAIDRNQQVRCR